MPQSRCSLPKGIYFEADRNRFRVRLYLQQQVVHRSYHRDLRDAIDALRRARDEREELRSRRQMRRRDLSSIESQVAALIKPPL